MPYLDKNGVTYLWSKIKTLLSNFTYTKSVIDEKIAGASGGTVITEIDESQIDVIISGETIVDDGNTGQLEEITEAEIDTIVS